LLEETHHLIPDSQTLTGWFNGDLYSPTNEIIGILPVPDSIHITADIESYQHNLDGKNKHSYLARQQKMLVSDDPVILSWYILVILMP
jgi:hypothetical protein